MACVCFVRGAGAAILSNLSSIQGSCNMEFMQCAGDGRVPPKTRVRRNSHETCVAAIVEMLTLMLSSIRSYRIYHFSSQYAHPYHNNISSTSTFQFFKYARNNSVGSCMECAVAAIGFNERRTIRDACVHVFPLSRDGAFVYTRIHTTS